ncbi:MAG: RdgB/HAM1 family non-canonical purine NTP pyrophosphatase [Bacteroidia bacterium]|nr:RdgB/HAM1 family non-canonical purine NTP pyrophosphatase [Bacteroidia bacterium]
MKEELIFATGNPHKLEEVISFINLPRFDIKSLKDIGFDKDIPETADTLKGNALIKAQAIWDFNAKNVFSEDTGLEVCALNMEPGVKTARYAGPNKSNHDNIEKLLNEMEGKADRRARFRTVAALIYNGEKYFFEGEVWGEIGTELTGNGGFGYDPIFIPDGYDKSFAELPSSIKNGISHRYNAIIKMAKFLSSL